MREKLEAALVCLEAACGIAMIAIPAVRAMASKIDACKASVLAIKARQK
ncbi:MAG: hypothetical protein IJK01_06085 [Clostridia bacterium]|nr:hypothetical protein [Clostridia bacterium]